jgi:mandelate racemase
MAAADMIVFNQLTLRSLFATAVALPMKRPLGTSAQTIDSASLLLVDPETDEGIRGHAYAVCYLPSIARALVPIVAELSSVLAEQPLVPGRAGIGWNM